MSNKMKVLRSTVPAKRPAGREFGELWVNHADKVMGYIDSSGNPVVPFALPNDIVIHKFDATKAYVGGDLVLGPDGTLYTAKAAVPAGAWNAAKWNPSGYTHYVDVAGDTMTGPLTLSGAPTVDLHAATKKYVDDADAAAKTKADADYVNVSGDTMTGALVLPAAAPTLGTHATNKTYVDTKVPKASVLASKGPQNLSAAMTITPAVNDVVTAAGNSATVDASWVGITAPVVLGAQYQWDGAKWGLVATDHLGSIALADERFASHTFLQAGAGAVARTAQAKMRDVVSVKDFGAVGDGVADDGAAIQAAIDYATGIGGQTVACGGLTYRVTSPIIVKDDVKLDLQGGKILSVLSGTNDYGVRLRNRAEVCNGEIEVQSSGTPGGAACIHAPLVVGPFSGQGGTAASPSIDEGVTGWAARNLKLSTNRDGKVCINIIGGANNGIIENIEAPSSSTLGGVVHLDWGFVGTADASNIPANRTNFDAGTAYTTHPHNIIIRNIKVGSLSRAKGGVDIGSHLVRLSGVYNISVQNVTATQCTYAAVRVTAGDLGFEFAPAAIKPMAMRGIRLNGVSVESTTDSWLIYCDSYADNVARAMTGGYVPLMDPLIETDMIVDQVTGKGSGGASVTPGLYVVQISGAKFTNINATGYLHGCIVDERVRNVQIHGTFYSNRGHGIYVHHGINKPEDVTILPGTHCYQNGTDASFTNPAGIAIESSIRCRVDGALLGHRTASKETTQLWGLLVMGISLTDVEVENCHVFSVKTAGGAYSLLSNTDYGIVKLFRNNTAASGVTNKYGGLNIIPINRFLASDGTEVTHYTASRFALSADITPSAGTWASGDVIFYSNPPSGKTGTRCETAGTPGTWAQF